MIHAMMEDNSRTSFFPSYSLRHKSMNSSKRARSPDSPGDRPLKRLSLAASETGRSTYRHVSVSSTSSGSRQPSEDWVHQASGLRIDSPIYPPSDGLNPFAPQGEGVGGLPSVSGSPVDEDVDMAIEETNENVSQMHESPQRPHLALQTSNLSNSQNAMQQFMQQQQQPEMMSGPGSVHRHSYETRYAERVNASVQPPLINVVPASPVGVPPFMQQGHTSRPSPLSNGGLYTLDAEQQRQPTPPQSSPMAMAISPEPSYAQLTGPITPSGAKKRVVAFGPRANCEKCKDGIRHFIHYDYE